MSGDAFTDEKTSGTALYAVPRRYTDGGSISEPPFLLFCCFLSMLFGSDIAGKKAQIRFFRTPSVRFFVKNKPQKLSFCRCRSAELLPCERIKSRFHRPVFVLTAKPTRKNRLLDCLLYQSFLDSISSRASLINSPIGILPLSPSLRLRTETVPSSASLSPTTSIYGVF